MNVELNRHAISDDLEQRFESRPTNTKKQIFADAGTSVFNGFMILVRLHLFL